MTENSKLKEMQEARIQNEFWWPAMLYARKYAETTYWWQEEEGWNSRCAVWNAGEGKGVPYFEISGPDASRLLSDTCVNKIYGSKPGTVKNLLWCRADGKLIFDTLGLVTAPDVYQVGSSIIPLKYAMESKSYDVEIKMAASRTQIQVSGPNAYRLLQELTDFDLTQISPAHFNVEPIEFAGADCRMVRLTMTGEWGFEVQTEPQNHDKVFGAIMETGKKYGLERIGLRNHMVQHAEASITGVYYTDTCSAAATDESDPYYNYCVANNELLHVVGILKPKICGSFEPESYEDFMASPVDLGMTRLIDFNHDFPGKEALAAEVRHPKRKFVCLEWDSRDVVDVYASYFKPGASHERVDTPHYDYMEMPRNPRLPIEASKVMADGREIAFTTSRTYMYSFRKMVSHCMIPVEYSAPGTKVTVIWGEPGHPQKEIRAIVTESPYKPAGNRSNPKEV